MNISALLVILIGSTVIPLLTALITKSTAPVLTKQVITAALSAVAALVAVNTQLDGTAYVSTTAAVLALGAFIATQGTYLGLYRPHEINARLAPTVGI